MGFKDILKQIKERKDAKKQAFKHLQEADQMQETLVERKKSANQRELERYIKENQEESIKKQLDIARKARDDDINFRHNPIDAKNIITATQWHVLKERNQFAGRSNMFQGQGNIHKSNPNLLKSGNVLHGKNIFMNKGGGLI